MVTIGFTFSISGLYVCVLEGTRASPKVKAKNKITLPANDHIPQLVEWFEVQLNLILNREKPDFVTYKLTINNVKNSFVSRVFYGQAILNLLCAKNDIPIVHTSPSAIVPSKFNLPKDSNLQDFIDEKLNSPQSPWDSKMKDTALMTLNILS